MMLSHEVLLPRSMAYVSPGTASMSYTNAINISLINGQCMVMIIWPKCIWSLLLISNDFSTHLGVFYSLDVEICRRAATSVDVHTTQSFRASQCFKSGGT